MTPAFGFSMGDFISAIGLVKRISKALKETGGASTEYQLVFIELKSLKNILRHLETLQPTEDNVTHINAIRGMALACQLPLRDFMVKLEKYESTLGPFADKRSFRAMAKKSKWAVMFTEEVERLRATVAAKNISLNLLLAMNTSQSLSRMRSRDKEKHSDLMSKAAEHRAALHKVQDGIEQVEQKVSRAGAAFDERLASIESNMSHARETSDRHFDDIGAQVVDTQTSVASLRTTGEQILRYLGTFPREMRELLQSILRANWQMYQVLLKIQQSTGPSPTGLLKSNIRFEDALGDYRELPYEYFRHWEPFEGFLRAQFKDKIGERKVLEGQYHIIDVSNSRAVVKKEHWTRSIEQGATLTMSMIMSHLSRGANSCPRPSCLGGELKKCPVSGLLSCKKCNLKFYPNSSDVGDSFNRLEEEEEVARRQNEDDLRLYGSRPEPKDAFEADVDTELPESPTRDSTTDFETAFHEVKKVDKTEVRSHNKTSIFVDEKAEANPLSSWLTQSALPSVVPERSHPLDRSAGSRVDPVEEEVREIERFRYVHLASDPVVDGRAPDTAKAEDTPDLELRSQIYLRNIVDRYPLLPAYLARRLAEANSSRYERLSHQRVEAMAKAKGKTAGSGLEKPPSTQERPSPGSIYGIISREGKAHKRARVRPETKSKKSKAPSKYQYVSSHDGTPNGAQYTSGNADKKRANSYASLSKSQPQYDYWNGGSPHHRTKSVGSRSSSKNSSLHGSPEFCYQKQYQNVDYFAPQPKYQYSSPGLPPPPVKLGKEQPSKRRAKKLSFNCDICGEHVKVNRRRQWQQHVMRDLRPYVCTARECDHSKESFTSILSFLHHEIDAHELYPLERSSTRVVNRRSEESIVCIFCGERTEAGKGDNSRGRHVGRHMEEIAFTVVPKAYEEWEFYSESSSTNSYSYEQTKSAMTIFRRAVAIAKEMLAWEVGTTSREATAKDAEKHGIPAGYSLKHWDPGERPIILLGSVFDANSLGKWIYDWTVFRDGAQTPTCDLAAELWLLLIKLGGTMTRIESTLSHSTNIDDEQLLENFLDSAERLWQKLEKVLKVGEERMLKSGWKNGEKQLGIASGCEFIDTLFGHDRQLETTEALMQRIRLWVMRCDANCEDLLKGGNPERKADTNQNSTNSFRLNHSSKSASRYEILKYKSLESLLYKAVTSIWCIIANYDSCSPPYGVKVHTSIQASAPCVLMTPKFSFPYKFSIRLPAPLSQHNSHCFLPARTIGIRESN